MTLDRIRQRPWEPGPDASHVDVVYRNSRLVDPETGQVQPKTHFRVQGNTIVEVWTGDDGPSSPGATAHEVDLGGLYVCPGLLDCHVHLTATPGSATLREMHEAESNTIAFRAAYVAKTMLLRGFTTVRDTGGADAALRDAIAENLLKGPRVFMAGKALSQTGGHGDFRARHQGPEHRCCGGASPPSLARVCDGVPQCLEAVRDELRKGADFIKIMCGGGVATLADPLEMVQFTAEEIRAITETARLSGKYVTAHAYTSMAIRHAVDNGVLGIEHGNFIDLPTAQYCQSKGVVVTPTLITYDAYVRAEDKPPFDTFLSPVGKAKNRQVLASGLEALKILYQAGVTMCYGSDLIGVLHPLQTGEFSLRAQVLPALEILRSATTNAARYLGMQGRLGCIKPSALCDFLVLAANPLEDITVLDRVEDNLLAIVKDGRVVASKLDVLPQDVLYRDFEL